MTDREIIKILTQRRNQIEESNLSHPVVNEYDYIIGLLYRMLENELEEEYKAWLKTIGTRSV